MRALIFDSKKNLESPNLNLENLKKNLKLVSVVAEEVNVDSPDGSQRAVSYDVMSFPAIVLIREDGAVQQVWQGELPDYGLIAQSVGQV
jgi:hypothetical protein